jgi:O-antigen/teichoic acid export membrane protein
MILSQLVKTLNLRYRSIFNLAYNDPLFRNSFYMILGRALNMGAGFLFWVLAARLYSVEDVGTATALISSLALVMLLSRLGFDYSLIRFLPTSHPNQVLTTVLSVTALSTLAICLVYLVLDSLLVTQLLTKISYALVFVLVAVFNSVTQITGTMFLATRISRAYLVQNLLMCLRLLLLFPLMSFRFCGIFLSLGLSYVLASLQAMVTLKKRGIRLQKPAISKPFLKRSIKFSLGNFISNCLNQAPGYLLPIMVLHLVDPGSTAKFYIAFTIGDLAMVIPAALSTSLFVEGSYHQPLKGNLIKALGAGYLSLVPCVVIIFLLGKSILGFIDPTYAEAYSLLQLIAVSKFVEVLFVIYISVQNIKLKVKAVIRINIVWFVMVLTLSFLLIPRFDALGAAYAILFTYLVLALVMLGEFFLERRSGEEVYESPI